MELTKEQLNELKLHLETTVRQKLDQWRAESVVVDTRKDPSMRAEVEKMYAASRASNRLHANALTQRQQHRQAYSKELQGHVDALIGGQHAVMDSVNNVHTWLFHDGQQDDQRWQVLLDHINKMNQFMEDQKTVNETVMAFIDKVAPELLEEPPADQAEPIW